MTTTAAAWRHVERNARNPKKPWELCVEPPDPTSPCGGLSGHLPCNLPGATGVRDGWRWKHPRVINGQPGYDHEYVPTRCECGHALEAVR